MLLVPICLIVINIHCYICCKEGQWGVPFYTFENNSVTEDGITWKGSEATAISNYKQDYHRVNLSLEETYLRHIVRKIVEKSDPFLNFSPKINNKLEFIDFYIRFDCDTISELKKIVAKYNSKHQLDENNDFKVLTNLLDSFNRMSKIKSNSRTINNEVKLSENFLSHFNIKVSILPTICYHLSLCIIGLFIIVMLRNTFHINPITTIIGLSIIHAVVFEYIKLYFEATAKRFSTISKGVPSSCLPYDKIGVVNSISNFIRHTFTFYHDECYKYYRYVHVEPILDVSLLEAVSSVFKNFVSSYVIDISRTIGKSIYVLMYQFPVQWQFIIFATTAGILLFYLVLLFKVEVHGWLFSTSYYQPSIKQCNKYQNELNFNKQKSIINVPKKLHFDTKCGKITSEPSNSRLKRSLSVGDTKKFQSLSNCY